MNLILIVKHKPIHYKFSGFSKLTSINVKNFKTNKVIDLSYLFDRCSSLTSFDSFNIKVLNMIKYLYYMLIDCTNL